MVTTGGGGGARQLGFDGEGVAVLSVKRVLWMGGGDGHATV